MRKLSHQQETIWSTLGRHYRELKTKRNDLKAEYLRQVERDMQAARENFALEVQEAFEQHGLTIADIMRAMGTTSRNTVNDYLKDARARKAAFPEAPVLPYEVCGVWGENQGNPSIRYTWAIVFDGENTWDVTFDEARYSVFEAVEDETTTEGYGRTGPEKKFNKALDNNAPEWLTWLVQQDEWKEKL